MIWSLFYALLTWIALPFALLYHGYRSVSRGRMSAFGERFGTLAPPAAVALQGGPMIWLHAVSVGEVMAARPLLRGVRQRYPGHRLLLTVTTETGRGVAERDGLADAVTYFPFDIGPAVRRLLNSVSPQAIIIMETEIWPVFSLEVQRRGIPLLLANGRISQRSFPRYQRFAWFFKPVLERFSGLGMQSEADLQRILSIGAPVERTQVLGNLKYDIPFGSVETSERLQLRGQYRIPDQLLVLTAGSTHPGEEQLVLDAWSSLPGELPGMLLILVPRHPERASEVVQLLKARGLPMVLRSQLEQYPQQLQPGQVLLVDTVGELMQLYVLADLAYVGGSLVATGGHNLLEPASRGIPLLFGPHMDNFAEIRTLVLDYGAGVQVADQRELREVALEFLLTPELRQVVGTNGLKLLRDRGGAVGRHLDMLSEVLPP